MSERTNTINQRLSQRNIPTYPLQPNINCRPVSTKYAILPLIDLRRHIKYPLQAYPTYNMATNFNPGTLRAPISGINTNLESDMHNQIFALQRCTQASYVPKATSDLYQDSMNMNAAPPETHQDLFLQQKWDLFNPNSYNFKTTGFNNSTRNDLKNL